MKVITLEDKLNKLSKKELVKFISSYDFYVSTCIYNNMKPNSGIDYLFDYYETDDEIITEE